MICPECGGSGEARGWCGHCSGNGVTFSCVDDEFYGGDPEAWEKNTCLVCRGEGWNFADCPRCGGTGEIEEVDDEDEV